MDQVVTAAGDAAETASGRFVIDGRSSRFTVRAFATGILSVMGHNPTIGIGAFNGEMRFDPDRLSANAFHLAIKTSSLSVLDEISDRDRREMERLMNQEVLETAKFPEILYEAPNISVTKIGDTLFSASLDGTLTMHGVTRDERITTRVALLGNMLRASGEFSVLQSSYEIKPISVAGGSLKLKDELQCRFEMVARKQE